ncbi:unnamed protein product, partial [Oppiella nova]
MYSSFAESHELSDNELSHKVPNVYLLLKESIPFDVTKMFCWQSMNKLVEQSDDNMPSTVFNQLPHFSNTKLADLYGLKANLTFTYYLNQGRVVEAYNRFIVNRKVLNSKSIELACRRAALVAYNDTTDYHIAVDNESLLRDHRLNIFFIQAELPIIYSSFAESHELSDNELSHKVPNVYLLLKESIPFDVTKMFCWQSMNKLVEQSDDNMPSMVFNQLPHFSNTKLADLYGLKANLTFTYYLNQGRVVEAYNRFIVNRKVLNSKSIELACRRAALVAYNDTTDYHIAVSCVVFQQLLCDDSTQTLLHLSIANIVMSYAADFLGLNARQQQTELSNLLKRSHYYSDKRSSGKLLQLAVTAITRKYRNFMNIQIEECFDWKITIRFAELHGLELPLDLLNKCAASDNWLVFTICCQLHQYPKELVFNSLKQFNNECISDHLYKAFQSSNTILMDSESSDNSKILNRKESQKRSNKHLRNVLYSRIGLSRAQDIPDSPNPRYPKNSFRNSSIGSPIAMDNDDMSIASETTDYNGIETISVVSSSNASDGEEMPNLNANNCPKDLFQLVLSFQTDSSYDPRKPLMHSSIPLSNPILCLIACSADYGSQKFNTFSAFSSWLLASMDTEILLLRDFEFARIQDSFSDGKLLSAKIDVEHGFKATNETYCAIVKTVISNLQHNGYFIEARNFANNAEIESIDLIINEWTLRAAHNLDSFEFWINCWDSLTAIDDSLVSSFKVFNKFLSQIPSLTIKSYLIFKCLIASQHFDNQRESSAFEVMLWKCIVQIENNVMDCENDNNIWSRIWSDIIEPNKTLDKVIEKLLNNSCIEKAHEVSLLFQYSHQDLDIILACDNMAKGLIRNLSEAPLSVQLKTKATEKLHKTDLSSDFTSHQKELIGIIESMSSLSTIGRKACQRVLLDFKISCILQRSYSSIECTEWAHLELLKALITVHSKANDALSLAKELIALNNISDDDIASIICTETLYILKNESQEYENRRESSFSNLVEMSTSFLSMVRLLNDTTILGTKLLAESDKLLNDSNNNFILTKLYIKAHECFAHECDVKGIALVLR